MKSVYCRICGKSHGNDIKVPNQNNMSRYDESALQIILELFCHNNLSKKSRKFYFAYP